jgi:hypothetical protein
MCLLVFHFHNDMMALFFEEEAEHALLPLQRISQGEGQCSRSVHADVCVCSHMWSSVCSSLCYIVNCLYHLSSSTSVLKANLCMDICDTSYNLQMHQKGAVMRCQKLQTHTVSSEA